MYHIERCDETTSIPFLHRTQQYILARNPEITPQQLFSGFTLIFTSAKLFVNGFSLFSLISPDYVYPCVNTKGERFMQYRKLGNTGLIVSAFALGTMQFGKKMNMGNLDQKATNEMVKFALDHGINFIDTADVYSRGESETLLGNALKGVREEIVLATKVRLPMSENFNRSGSTRVNIMHGIETSLKRLQTDYIDLYQVHGWDSNTPLEETLRALDDLVRQGKVRYIGFSNYLAWQAATALEIQKREHLEKFVTAQMYYSLVGRDLEHEFVSFAGYHNIGILVWSPLAGGFLSGKYERNAAAPEGTRFAEAGRFVPFDLEKGHDIVETVKEAAQNHGASPAQVALAWLLSRPMVSSVIIAARKITHLKDDIAAIDLKLEDEEMRLLDEASDPGTPYPKWMVLQLDQAEDPRPKVLEPERFADGGLWKDLRDSS
jgi:aryl-alcohol dehydrogenase-like predicted oxidoreductase